MHLNFSYSNVILVCYSNRAKTFQKQKIMQNYRKESAVAKSPAAEIVTWKNLVEREKNFRNVQSAKMWRLLLQ